MDEVKTEEPQAAKDAKAEADWKAEADRKADDDELKKSMGEVIRKLDTAKTPEEQKDALAAAKTWLLEADATKYAGPAAQIDLAVYPPLVTAAVTSMAEYMRQIEDPSRATAPDMTGKTNGNRSPL